MGGFHVEFHVGWVAEKKEKKERKKERHRVEVVVELAGGY